MLVPPPPWDLPSLAVPPRTLFTPALNQSPAAAGRRCHLSAGLEDGTSPCSLGSGVQRGPHGLLPSQVWATSS